MGISGAIVLGLKGLVYFLEKEGHMNSDIYINQVLKKLGLPFYNQCIEEKGSIIWMDNGACYYTSKITIVLPSSWINLYRLARTVSEPQSH